MEHLLVYDYNLSWFHRDQHIVDAHSDNFQIDVGPNAVPSIP